MTSGRRRPAAVVVAHPDDETIWTGGTVMELTEYDWFVAAVTRRSDADRAPRFSRAMEYIGAEGALADLDDGPGQDPIDQGELARTILSLLPRKDFRMLLTHGPRGEYERHRRHEEVSAAVTSLWTNGEIKSDSLLTFDYEYDSRKGLSYPSRKANVRRELSDATRARKRFVMTSIYGFDRGSFEVRTLPGTETFRRVRKAPKPG